MKKRDEALPELFDQEEFRHPIWTKPVPNTDEPEPLYIWDLRCRLWSSMQPFDGRPNMETIVKFAQDVWTLCALTSAHQDPFWLVGQIVRVRMEAERKSSVGVVAIRRLCQDYIDTIVGAL